MPFDLTILSISYISVWNRLIFYHPNLVNMALVDMKSWCITKITWPWDHHVISFFSNNSEMNWCLIESLCFLSLTNTVVLNKDIHLSCCPSLTNTVVFNMDLYCFSSSTNTVIVNMDIHCFPGLRSIIVVNMDLSCISNLTNTVAVNIDLSCCPSLTYTVVVNMDLYCFSSLTNTVVLKIESWGNLLSTSQTRNSG